MDMDKGRKETRYAAGDRATIKRSRADERSGVKPVQVEVIDPNYANKGGVEVKLPDGSTRVVEHFQLLPVESAPVTPARVDARMDAPDAIRKGGDSREQLVDAPATNQTTTARSIGKAAEIERGGK